jgi:PKD repeat protein
VCLAEPGEYTWTITASGPGGTATEDATLTVDNIGPPVVTFSYEALPPDGTANEVTLLFTIDGAYESAVLTPPNGAPIEVDQLTEFGPLCADNQPPAPPPTEPPPDTQPPGDPECAEGTFLWTLTVTGPGGETSEQLDVVVPPPPDSSTSSTA